MLQPSDIRASQPQTDKLARSFYGMLKNEGFTPDQVIDLLLCLLDQVHDDATTEAPAQLLSK